MSWLARLWTSVRGTCVTCGRKLVVQTLPECHGARDGITVTFHNLPYRACPSGYHERRYPSHAFAGRLARALLDGDRFPAVRIDRHGPLTCGRCGGALGKPARHEVPVSGELRLRGLPSFAVTIQGLTVRCPNCAADQLAVDLRTVRSAAQAIRAALDAAELRR